MPWSRSSFHSSAMTPLMEFFCQHLVHAAAAAAAASHPPFERFLMRGMLFLNATLRSSTFRGTAPVQFRVSEAAQQQVRMCTLHGLAKSPIMIGWCFAFT